MQEENQVVEKKGKLTTDSPEETPTPTTPETTSKPSAAVAPPTATVQPSEPIAIEEGEATPSEMREILEQRYWTIKELAERLGYTPTWIQMQCKSGRIRAVKPMGGRWRIPESEAERVVKEGIPPLPREEKRPLPTRIPVSEDKVDKVMPHRKEPEEEKVATEKGRGAYWPLPFDLKSK